ncbi:hypothetical protein L484_002099 [Morus notabilis]|uniref:Uncharacterized protein n=1 Tax=Morus notabilis TaxID=981085 RepID=W9RDZ2_9ROSA|nr:hypothetical protein L484_002099 [Morus notabilis]
MAQDLRLFVQSFNMSRQFQNHSSSSYDPPLEDDPPLQHLSPSDCKRPRTDWTEFLDPDHEICEDIEQGGVEPAECGFEPEIVTELPEGLYQKAKLNRSADGDELYKPVFSKRNSNKRVLFQGN